MWLFFKRLSGGSPESSRREPHIGRRLGALPRGSSGLREPPQGAEQPLFHHKIERFLQETAD